MKHLGALIKKEFLQIKRDPSTLLIAFILPCILLFIFGYGVNLDNTRIKLGVVNEDQSVYIDSLLESLNLSSALEVSFFNDIRECEDLITAGKLRGALKIPKDFSQTLRSTIPDSALLLTLADGSEPNLANFVHNSVKSIVQRWWQNQYETMKQPISINTRFWYNQELKSRDFLLPGAIAIIMTIVGTLLTAMVVAREWERGTMESLLATPISIFELLLGKLIPYFILGLGSMTLCCVVATQLYAIPFRGSILMLYLVSSLFLITALGQGLLISVIAKDQFIASQVALMSAYLPAFMLSGFIFEIASMPFPIQCLTYLFAARYLVPSLQTLFLVGDIMPILLWACCMITLLGMMFYFLIFKKMTKRLY